MCDNSNIIQRRTRLRMRGIHSTTFPFPHQRPLNPFLMTVYTEQISLHVHFCLNKLRFANTGRGTSALVVLCLNKIMKEDNVQVLQVSLLGNFKIDAKRFCL